MTRHHENDDEEQVTQGPLGATEANEPEEAGVEHGVFRDGRGRSEQLEPGASQADYSEAVGSSPE